MKIEFPCHLKHYANANGNWRAKAGNARRLRHLVAWTLIVHRTRPEPPCTVTMTRCAPRRYDSDNLIHAFKPIRDEIAVWLGVDDRHDDRVMYVCKQEQTRAGQYFVRIEIEPMGDSHVEIVQGSTATKATGTA